MVDFSMCLFNTIFFSTEVITMFTVLQLGTMTFSIRTEYYKVYQTQEIYVYYVFFAFIKNKYVQLIINRIKLLLFLLHFNINNFDVGTKILLVSM